ncbi:hypothetical protein D3C74_416410 [compost metagenome]
MREPVIIKGIRIQVSCRHWKNDGRQLIIGERAETDLLETVLGERNILQKIVIERVIIHLGNAAWDRHRS